MVQHKLLKKLASCVKIWKTKKVVFCKFFRREACLWKNLRRCIIVLMKRVKNQRKWYKTIQVLQKDLKFEKAARKAEDNSTCLHSDSLEINTGKSQRNKSVLVAQLREDFIIYSMIKNIPNRWIISFFREWSAFNITQKNTTQKMQHKKIQHTSTNRSLIIFTRSFNDGEITKSKYIYWFGLYPFRIMIL